MKKCATFINNNYRISYKPDGIGLTHVIQSAYKLQYEHRSQRHILTMVYSLLISNMAYVFF